MSINASGYAPGLDVICRDTEADGTGGATAGRTGYSLFGDIQFPDQIEPQQSVQGVESTLFWATPNSCEPTLMLSLELFSGYSLPENAIESQGGRALLPLDIDLKAELAKTAPWKGPFSAGVCGEVSLDDVSAVMNTIASGWYYFDGGCDFRSPDGHIIVSLTMGGPLDTSFENYVGNTPTVPSPWDQAWLDPDGHYAAARQDGFWIHLDISGESALDSAAALAQLFGMID